MKFCATFVALMSCLSFVQGCGGSTGNAVVVPDDATAMQQEIEEYDKQQQELTKAEAAASN